MRRVVSLIPVSLFSMVWLALAPGCAMDEEGGPEDELAEEVPEDVPPEEEGAASKGDGTSMARENGDWCHARCSFANIVYAGPNVTRNCHDWGHIVCHNRSSELVNAYWCAPLQCRIDAILQ